VAKTRTAANASEETGSLDERAASGGATGTHGGQKGEDMLGDFAEELGRVLGTVQSRASSWLEQRKDIADQLTQIRDTANQYLQQLGAEGTRLAERFEKARRGRPPASAKQAGPPPPGTDSAPAPTVPRRTMSAEARARIAAAQRKRWARQRRQQAGRQAK
jgi:hypothetical protein